MKQLLLLLMMTFLSVWYAGAEEVTLDDIDSLLSDAPASDKPDTGSETESLTLSLSGTSRVKMTAPVIPDYMTYDGLVKSPGVKNEAGIEMNFSILRLKSNWEIDLYGRSDGKEWTDYIKVAPLENYIKIKPWRFTIGAGYQYFSWGTADGNNPTDVINAFDYSYGALRKKLPVLSAYVEFFPVNQVSFEFVYLPFAVLDVYPQNIPDMLSQLSGVQNIHVEELEYKPEYFTMGGKINAYTQYIDFSFSYVNKYDSFFTPDIELQPVMGPGMIPAFYKIESISLEHRRIHHFGADFRIPVERFTVWGEVSYKLTDDYDLQSYYVKNHQFSWATGFDIMFGPDDDFYFNIQYTGDFIPLYDASLSTDYKKSVFGTQTLPFESGKEKSYYEEYYYRSLTQTVGGQTEGLLQGISMVFKLPFTIEQYGFVPSLAMAYKLPLIYNDSGVTRLGSAFINPEFSFSPVDNLTIIAGSELYYSWEKNNDTHEITIAKTDKLGIFHKDSHIYFGMEVAWGANLKK